MPPSAKRRKDASKSHAPMVAPSKQQGIQAFGKVTKVQVYELGKSNLKRKQIEETTELENENPFEDQELKKRKIGLAQSPLKVQKDVLEKEAHKPVVIWTRKRKASKEPATPLPEDLTTVEKDKKRKKVAIRSKKLTETPTKGARSLLEKFALGASSSPARDSSPSPIKYETPPSSPPSLAEDGRIALPDELQDLTNLHSSFLTALSLYYAHNGISNPADLRNLYSGIERTWKKRSVSVDDIRRILAITQSQDAEEKNLLCLSDYGHNKICVEISETALQGQGPIIDETALNQAFIRNLSKKWSQFKKIPTVGHPSPPAFLSHLPLLPLTTSVSLADLKPLLAKGQHRLADLKASAIAAQSRNALSSTSLNPSTPSNPTTPKNPNATTKNRASSLLDRLTAKSLSHSTLPEPPTAAQLARKRCLQRLPEIAPVLQSLALGAQKHDNNDTAIAEYTDAEAARARIMVQRQASFTMATLVQHLQMSLRNPIAREEAVRSVRLMAEVLPEWVAVKEVGRCVGVVVRGGGVGRGELEGRVRGVLEVEGL